MKFKYFMLSLIVALGVFLADFSSVQALSTFENTPNSIVHSGGTPIPIYTNSGCTNYSGQTLNTTINDWLVLSTSHGDHYSTYELGANQWIRATDLRIISTNPTDSPYMMVYSGGKDTSLYHDALLTTSNDTLSKTVTTWKVTKTAWVDQSDELIGFDLGNNQWVKSSDVTLIYRAPWFKEDTPLYNEKGIKAGSIATTSEYKIYDAKTINDQLYVRLGSDTQWTDYALASRFPPY